MIPDLTPEQTAVVLVVFAPIYYWLFAGVREGVWEVLTHLFPESPPVYLVEDFDRCGGCSTPLDDRNRAVTCGEHPLCLRCDGPTPCCHVGRYRRETPVWTVDSDPFLDTTGGAA